MGAVHLTVSNLERSVDYYESVIGLRVRDRGGARAMLGAGGEDLLVLVEQPGASPARGSCGLYHFALVLPERGDLARWFAHAARARVPLAGIADHFVSEAIYLSDPDGHGIEIYWDRPREVWEGRVAERMITLPLDTSSLFGELAAPASESLDPASGSFEPGGESVDPLSGPFDGLPAGTTMGHVHLCVADVPRTVAFYRDVLGFALMASLGGQAAFDLAGVSNGLHAADALQADDRGDLRLCGCRRSGVGFVVRSADRHRRLEVWLSRAPLGGAVDRRRYTTLAAYRRAGTRARLDPHRAHLRCIGGLCDGHAHRSGR